MVYKQFSLAPCLLPGEYHSLNPSSAESQQDLWEMSVSSLQSAAGEILVSGLAAGDNNTRIKAKFCLTGAPGFQLTTTISYSLAFS